MTELFVFISLTVLVFVALMILFILALTPSSIKAQPASEVESLEDDIKFLLSIMPAGLSNWRFREIKKRYAEEEK